MNQQTTLFGDIFTPPQFGGKTFKPEFDAERLTGQWRRVWGAMVDGEWRTLNEIQRNIEYWYEKYDSEAAISARLRDFRKVKFGGHTVNRRRRGDAKKGLFEYQLVTASADGRS